MSRGQWLLGGAALLALAALMLHPARQAIGGSLLCASWLCAGLGAGALSLWLIHELAGGAWGEALRPALGAIALSLPISALATLLWLPSLDAIFAWTHGLDPARQWYLNAPFFTARSLLALASWSLLAWWLARGARSRPLAVLGLLWLGLSGSLIAVDWGMSLTPDFHSAGYGLLSLSGWALGALALAVLLSPLRSFETQTRQDLGALLLCLVLLWAYLAYMDYLTAWIGDQPQALAWYWPRLRSDWRHLMAALVLLRVLLPVLMLLAAQARRSPLALRVAAGSLVLAQVLGASAMILPSLRGAGMRWQASDGLALLGLGGLCGLVVWTALPRLREAAP